MKEKEQTLTKACETQQRNNASSWTFLTWIWSNCGSGCCWLKQNISFKYSFKSSLNKRLTCVVVGGGLLGGGRVLTLFDLVLSQQTDPVLQFDVLGINTDGRSQKAAII